MPLYTNHNNNNVKNVSPSGDNKPSTGACNDNTVGDTRPSWLLPVWRRSWIHFSRPRGLIIMVWITLYKWYYAVSTVCPENGKHAMYNKNAVWRCEWIMDILPFVGEDNRKKSTHRATSHATTSSICVVKGCVVRMHWGG